jgi:hypothetical protein
MLPPYGAWSGGLLITRRAAQVPLIEDVTATLTHRSEHSAKMPYNGGLAPWQRHVDHNLSLRVAGCNGCIRVTDCLERELT